MRTDRHRAKYIRWVRKRSLLALNKQLKYFLDRGILTAEGVETFIQEDDIIDLYRDIYTTVGKSFAKETNKKLNQKKSEFNESWYTNVVNEYIALEGAEAVTAITEHTKKVLKVIIARGIDEGVTMQGMAKYIRSEVAQTYKNRALTIARTETVSASNFGALQGANMTGLDLWKIWIPAIDRRSRDGEVGETDHVSMASQKVDKDDVFIEPTTGERLSYPGDRSNGATARNVINCRCALGFEKK